MNKLTIEFDEKGIGYNLEQPAALEEIFWVLLNACVAVTNQTLKAGESDPEFKEAKVRKDIYDVLNKGFTNILQTIDPTQVRHPNLTEVAILLAENTLLKEADAAGMTVEEYLPIAEKANEKLLKLWKLNEKAGREHKQKLDRQRREAKPNNAFKVMKGGK